jgi:hypothetical protein
MDAHVQCTVLAEIPATRPSPNSPQSVTGDAVRSPGIAPGGAARRLASVDRTRRILHRLRKKELRGPGASCARSQAPVLSRHQRLEVFGGMGAWVTAWPFPAVSMPPDRLCTMAAWFVGEGPHLLRPLIGLPLRIKGKEWGVVNEHVGWRYAVREWMVRCARAMTRSSMPLLAVPWMRAFECGWRCMECSLALCVRQIGAV